MADQQTGYSITWKIPFEDNKYRLTTEELDKYADKEIVKRTDWHWPSLKFISYKNGILTLQNNHKKSVYLLTLKVEDPQLQVQCSCGSRNTSLCKHAHAGLSLLLIMQGKDYFKKLLPNNEFDLAFSHPACFDKKESAYGINVSPRKELRAVFQLKSNADPLELQGLLNIHFSEEESIPTSGPALAYLVLIPWRQVIVPAVLPCVGNLNKERNQVKSWIHYLNKVEEEYGHLITSSNKELISASGELWKLIAEKDKSKSTKNSMETFSGAHEHWQKIWPMLLNQPLVYAYEFYGVRETKRRPFKNKVSNITLSERTPKLKFVLQEKSDFYEFHMQFWLQEDLLEHIDHVTVFFIVSNGIIYRIPKLKDSLIISWMLDTGGWITVFKEHYGQFAEEVLIPLQGKYSIDTIPFKRKKST